MATRVTAFFTRVGPHPHALTPSRRSARAYLEQNVAKGRLRHALMRSGCSPRAYLEQNVAKGRLRHALMRSGCSPRAYLIQNVAKASLQGWMRDLIEDVPERVLRAGDGEVAHIEMPRAGVHQRADRPRANVFSGRSGGELARQSFDG